MVLKVLIENGNIDYRNSFPAASGRGKKERINQGMAQMSSPGQPKKPFFNREGAGILVLAKDTGRLLAMKRSDHVQHGRYWAVTGGLLDDASEDPAKGAAREFKEETNYSGPAFDLIPLTEYKAPNFTYHNFLAVVDHEFKPDIDHENEGFKWVDSLEDWPDPVHFGIKFLLEDAASMKVIREAQAACLRGQAPDYPPTLFHVEPALQKGEDIQPYKGKGPTALVHASPNLREAISSLAPKDVRIANVRLPGSEDFITIIEDRENFLKNGKFEGVICLFSGEGFTQKRGTHWVSEEPVAVGQRNFFSKIYNIEDGMRYGLHVLFTPGPVTAEEKQKIRDAALSPDPAAALKKLVEQGVLAYENAARGVHVSPQLQPGMEGEVLAGKQPFIRRFKPKQIDPK